MKSVLAILIGFTVGIIACGVLLWRWVKACFLITWEKLKMIPEMIKIGPDTLNRNELIRGAVLGALLTPLCGVWALGVIPAAAYLYALSGCNGRDKIWRRIWMPALCAIVAAVNCHKALLLLGWAPGYGLMTLGYGLPTYNAAGELTDKGSLMGQLIFKYITTNEKAATIIEHGVIFWLWVIGYFAFYR